MSRRRRRPSAAEKRLKEARHICEREFEPLWRPAPYVTRAKPRDQAERLQMQTEAREQALAWLALRLGCDGLTDFCQIGDLETLRRAYRFINRATINDVRRWARERQGGACLL